MDVKAAVLEKVIQFCTHHADPSNPFSDIEKVSGFCRLVVALDHANAIFCSR